MTPFTSSRARRADVGDRKGGNGKHIIASTENAGPIYKDSFRKSKHFLENSDQHGLRSQTIHALFILISYFYSYLH